MGVADYLDKIIDWTNKRSDITALILTGSLARQDRMIDELSDIDIEIIAERPQDLLKNSDWIGEIGDILTYLPLDPDENQAWATRLVFYRDGTKVDFTLADSTRLQTMIDAATLDSLYQRGYRALLDKNGVASQLPAASGISQHPPLPTQKQFQASVEEFWFEAAHIPKYLYRGELWTVKLRDWTMKELLLQMMEWQALAKSTSDVDTWHQGSHMPQWLAPHIWQELHQTFGQFDADSARQAFYASIQLYSQLARKVAESLSLKYPQQVEDGVLSLCKKIEKLPKTNRTH